MPVRYVGEVDACVPQTGQEAIQRLVVEGLCGDESAQFTAYFVAIARLVEAGARRSDDAGVGGKLIVAVAQIERRKQFPDGEIAGSAENDEVTGCHGGRGRHEIS